MEQLTPAPAPIDDLARDLARLDQALERLEAAPDFAKPTRVRPVLDALPRVLRHDGGPAAVEQRAATVEASGVFAGTDWAAPEQLDPARSVAAFTGADADTTLIECLSDLRLVAVAHGELTVPEVSADHARAHLAQVLAHNLTRLFGAPTEAERVRQGRLATIARTTLRHVADRIGYEQVLDQLVDEIWRVLLQRPIQIDHVKRIITEIAVYLEDPDIELGQARGLERLITSLYGPTLASREDPGIEVYRERLATLDRAGLRSEAAGFARAMHDTGLVSPYHTVFVRAMLEHDDVLVAEALGLSAAARDSLLHHRELVHCLIEEAVHPETARAVLGLTMLLERGLLHRNTVPPALWRQLRLPLSAAATERLSQAYGTSPPPRSWLIAGVLNVLGLPLGIGQGDNPTCQSARALSMWADNDPDHLLWLVAAAARDDEVIAHFEGQPISSREVEAGLATSLPVDLDPVSLLVVPHLDRIYAEMGRRCADRDGDPHRWVNPEFHGRSAWRGFRIAVDVATGRLVDLAGFLRELYATYHPDHNGDQPLIHPQPAGLAVTDTAGRFLGWHAITLLRAAPDPTGVVRAYFYNPNDDGGQDWGDGVVVGTSGHGEGFGESSLPFDQLASRLYIFHVDPREQGEVAAVGDEVIRPVIDQVHRTWGADRLPELDPPP